MPTPAEVNLHRRYWQRSILIPLWTQQFLLQLTGAIIFWFAITIYWGGGPKHGPDKGQNRGEQAILASFFILYLSLLLATLSEILLFCVSALKPKGYFAIQLAKTVASIGVWSSLVMYPYVIKDPLASRMQAAVGMEAVFAWLQIPMLSSLVHAGLVWHEERKIKREMAERNAALQAAADAATSPFYRPETTERMPLLAHGSNNARVFGGGRRRAGSVV